jgi:hypothetical protein
MASESLAVVDPSTGELLKAETAISVPTKDVYFGASMNPVDTKKQEILLESVDPNDVEIKPDGIVYLPEIKYRRKLNLAFGPMGWSMIPRDKLTMKGNTLYRPYALIANGCFVAEAIGSQQYFENNGNMNYADAAEGVKSNALQRCCKDLGIASELWDPGWIATWKSEHAIEVSAVIRGKRQNVWRRKDRQAFDGEKQPNPLDPVVNDGQTQNVTQPTEPVQSAPGIITSKQASRIWAVGHSKNLDNSKIGEIIRSFGYEKADQVRISDYDKLITAIELGICKE